MNTGSNSSQINSDFDATSSCYRFWPVALSAVVLDWAVRVFSFARSRSCHHTNAAPRPTTLSTLTAIRVDMALKTWLPAAQLQAAVVQAAGGRVQRRRLLPVLGVSRGGRHQCAQVARKVRLSSARALQSFGEVAAQVLQVHLPGGAWRPELKTGWRARQQSAVSGRQATRWPRH